MSLPNAPLDPTLDPITGLPVDQIHVPQYQLPLASQPINLSELNAQGKQSQWLYPDNIPPVVARLQARDLTNANNAQDLSTDGKRNLNVNIAANSAGSIGGSKGFSTGVLGVAFNFGKNTEGSDSSGLIANLPVSQYPKWLGCWANCTYMATVSSSNDEASGYIQLQGGTSGHLLWVAAFSFITMTQTINIPQNNAISYMFPYPIDMATAFPGDTTVQLTASFFDPSMFITGQVYFSL